MPPCPLHDTKKQYYTIWEASMSFYELAFSLTGFLVFFVVSGIIFITYTKAGYISDFLKDNTHIIVLAFVGLQILAFIVLMGNFSRASRVDISPLRELGEGQVDVETIKSVLEKEGTFRSEHVDMGRGYRSYDYAFYSYQRDVKGSVSLSFRVLSDNEEAHSELVSVTFLDHVRGQNLRKLSDRVYVNLGRSYMQRGADTAFAASSHRIANTIFTIDNYLFILREGAERHNVGLASSDVIRMICDIFESGYEHVAAEGG